MTEAELDHARRVLWNLVDVVGVDVFDDADVEKPARDEWLPGLQQIGQLSLCRLRYFLKDLSTVYSSVAKLDQIKRPQHLTREPGEFIDFHIYERFRHLPMSAIHSRGDKAGRSR